MNQNLVGKRFGEWTVLRKWRGNGRHYYVMVICSCGTERQMRADTLKSGRSKSCGCKKGEHISTSITRHGGRLKFPRAYKSWKEMRQRCMNKNNRKYPDYGGRGIKVCDRWNDFDAFAKDMGERPKGASLGRIDNNGNYSPENCRWESPKQQANNTRRNIFITFRGETKTIAQWSNQTGLKAGTIRRRFHAGKHVNEIFKEIL